MIIWFDEFGNRREQIYENGTLTAGSYAFDTLYVYWDNETNFKSKTSAQLQGTTVDFKLSNGTTIQGAVTTIESYQIPSLKDFDFKFFEANRVYKVIKCNIPSGVTSVDGIVTADIKVMVGGSIVKTLSGVDFVVQGHAATNANISDADYRNILANYMPYVGGTFTGPVVFEQGLTFDELNINKLQINDLAAIKKTTIGGDEYLDLGDDNNVYISGELYQEGEADFASNVEIEGTLTLGGSITDGTNTISVANIENKANKVSSISSASTDIQYPSAKLLFDTKEALSTRIGNLENRGRFLAVWNCATGQPTTYPSIPEGAEYPYTYTYRAGDYFIIGTVGQTNKKPSGTGMTKSTAQADWTVPSTSEADSVAVNDIYTFDGTNFVHIGGSISTAWGSITGTLNDQTDLKNALDAKAGLNASNTFTGSTNYFSGDVNITGIIDFSGRNSIYNSGDYVIRFAREGHEFLRFQTNGIIPSTYFGDLNLGLSSAFWNNIYAKGNIYLSSANANCWISGTDGDIYLRSHNGLVKTNSHIRPENDGTLSLGYTGKKWNQIYCNSLVPNKTAFTFSFEHPYITINSVYKDECFYDSVTGFIHFNYVALVTISSPVSYNASWNISSQAIKDKIRNYFKTSDTPTNWITLPNLSFAYSSSQNGNFIDTLGNRIRLSDDKIMAAGEIPTSATCIRIFGDIYVG